MYGTVLSVLLMGMVPVPDVPAGSTLERMTVSSPSPLASSALVRANAGGGITASGMVVVDLQSGQELYGRNADLRRPMGSLTKLMTALLIVENHSLSEEVTVPRTIGSVQGTVAGLPPGSVFSVGDVLSALLLASGNDAARTLAIFHSGSEQEFVQAMNARAKALGLQDTSFANAAGLDSPQQWSTPRDLSWLAQHALRYPALRSRMATASATITSTEGRVITLSHTHDLLHDDASGVVAGKTGTTVAAKQCLLSIVKEGGREYVVVLLGSRERYGDMRGFLRTLASVAMAPARVDSADNVADSLLRPS